MTRPTSLARHRRTKAEQDGAGAWPGRRRIANGGPSPFQPARVTVRRRTATVGTAGVIPPVTRVGSARHGSLIWATKGPMS
jgi:hypothetical protein